MARIARQFRRYADTLYPNIILYITCLGSSNISIHGILKTLSNANQALGGTASIFKEALNLVVKWGYTYSDAISYIITRIRHKQVQEFFKRLDYAIKAGVSIGNFSKIELQKFLNLSGNEFEKSLEKLKRIVEAYTTLLSIVSLLVVSFLLVSVIFGGVDARQILNISAITIFLTLSSTSLLFTTTNLRRKLFHKEPIRPAPLSLLERTSIPVLAISAFTISSKIFIPTIITPEHTLFFLTTAAGFPCFIHGFLGRRWHAKVRASEENLAVVIKSLGDYISVSGSLRSAARLMLLSDFGPINRLIKNMEVRIRAGIGHATALALLGAETLSNLGHRMFWMMGDLLEAGGRPSNVATYLSDYVTDQLMKDKRRQQVTGSLKGLALPLQATLAAILALMGTLFKIISQIAALIELRIRLLSPIDPIITTDFFYMILVGTSLITSLNIYLADGDSPFTLTFYFGVFLLVSGVTYLAMSLLSHQILSSFAGLSQRLSTLSGVR